MKKLLAFSIFCCFAFSSSFAQQLPNWSSFYDNGFIWNPALTGKHNSTELSAFQRQDWRGFDGAPMSTGIGLQLPLIQEQTKSIIGGYLLKDKVGPFNCYEAVGSYAYKVSPRLFGNDALALGMAFGLQNCSFRADDVIAYDPTNFLIENESYGQTNPVLNVGFQYSSVADSTYSKSHFFLGVAVTNILSATQINFPSNQSTRTPHINANFGFRLFPKNARHFFETNLLINYTFDNIMNTMIYERYERLDRFWLSAGLVTNQEYFLQAGIILDENSFLGGMVNGGKLKLGFKVDDRYGALGNYTSLGYEIYIGYIFGHSKNEVEDAE